MDLRYIVIEGNIGSGKTSLCKKIAENKNAKLILEEFSENPFLPKFYYDPDRYSFSLELSFLADRYNQLKNNHEFPDLFNSLVISDYYFMKSLIFASKTLKEDEYKLYRQLFNIIYNSLPKPDLYVYLHQTSENLLYNIKKRGRDYETDITEKYLKEIEDGYFKYFRQETNLKIVIIDVSNIDFIENTHDFDKIENVIFNKTHNLGINRVIF